MVLKIIQKRRKALEEPPFNSLILTLRQPREG
jgi:hypothetical protein